MIMMYFAAVIAVGIVVVMLIKKMDIKISLFFMGMLLMYIAIYSGRELAVQDFASTGAAWLDPLKAVADQFKSIITSSGFIILMLGGYSSYMTRIRANEITVQALIRPIAGIKSTYILIPVVFLVGNFLSLVVPSASNLAIILLATIYPVMLKVGMNPLTAGAVIATSATVMPTPLGSDNVAIAAELANTPQFAGLTASDYVFKYHVLVSVPTLLIMALAHYFWQKHEDKRYGNKQVDSKPAAEMENIPGGRIYRTVYAILPLLPILLLIFAFLLQRIAGVTVTLSVEVAVLFSFVISIICEIIRRKSIKDTLEDTESFFTGMGGAMPIVALLVAGTTFVVGLQSIGIIHSLQNAMTGISGQGMGFVLPLVMVLLTALIVILSGSGTALFFAMVPLMVPLTGAAGINVLALSIPMALAGNLLRAVSPVSAVVMIVAGSIGEDPVRIIRRTAVPMITGVIFMFVASLIIFL